MSKSKEAITVRVAGTTPLSFELPSGTTLSVKKYTPSANNRPTAGAKFKTNAYLLFHGVTKIGRLSDASLKKIDYEVPDKCTVTQVDEAKKILTVTFGNL